MQTISYEYRFELPGERTECFQIHLDGATLNPKEELPAELPYWTRLEFHRCDGCPLLPEEHSHCPLAARISPVVEHFSDVVSIDRVGVTVVMNERIITRSATAQEGISSLLGIIIATSGCPLTAFFKPMARFHLPFANTDETFYRAASMYMLAQYYRWQAGLSADLDMQGLRDYYAQVAKVNRAMAARIRDTQREDGAINAIVLLDMFVVELPYGIDATLNELKPLFEPYLVKKPLL
ncbi:MAG: hypothetical protein WC383_13780 [Gammaproteobacteria bacterium]